jgi:ATP-dependent Clp protease adaptor protein ClpS
MIGILHLTGNSFAMHKYENHYLCINNISVMKNTYQEELLQEVMEAVETTEIMDLVVFNDDVNTFAHVIDTLIKVCRHTMEQAEQCTTIIHYKGKCAVKNGSFEFLKPMREAICEAGIDARIL